LSLPAWRSRSTRTCSPSRQRCSRGCLGRSHVGARVGCGGAAFGASPGDRLAPRRRPDPAGPRRTPPDPPDPAGPRHETASRRLDLRTLRRTLLDLPRPVSATGSRVSFAASPRSPSCRSRVDWRSTSERDVSEPRIKWDEDKSDETKRGTWPLGSLGGWGSAVGGLRPGGLRWGGLRSGGVRRTSSTFVRDRSQEPATDAVLEIDQQGDIANLRPRATPGSMHDVTE
jgi:hypothetical protein